MDLETMRLLKSLCGNIQELIRGNIKTTKCYQTQRMLTDLYSTALNFELFVLNKEKHNEKI